MVTIESIAAAEELLGVSYTPAERAQMVGNLEGQIASALARRRAPPGNDVPMASRFDPRLPTTVLPGPQAPVRYSAVNVPCPSDDEAIAFAPLTHLSAWIRGGALSSRRLTEVYLSRIEELNGRLQ